MNYHTSESFSLAEPKSFEESNYNNRSKRIDAEADVDQEFNEEYRYTFPYRVRIKYSVGETDVWKGSDGNNAIDRKNAELAYINVDFKDKEDAKRFTEKAKRVLGRMIQEDSEKYLNSEAVGQIETRARSQAWGDRDGGTETRIRRGLEIKKVQNEQNIKAGLEPETRPLYKVRTANNETYEFRASTEDGAKAAFHNASFLIPPSSRNIIEVTKQEQDY